MEAAECPEPTAPVQIQNTNSQVDIETTESQTERLQSPTVAFSSYIVVLEEAQHPQLSEDPFAGHEVLENIGHLLQGHLAAIPGVSNRPGERDRTLVQCCKTTLVC